MAEEKLLEIEIVTPHEKIYRGSGSSVSLPGSLSSFQVLYNHAPIVSSLDTGITKVLDKGGEKMIFATGSGFAEVRQNKVSVLVETAVLASMLDKSAEEQALEQARLSLKEESGEDKDLAAVKIKEIKNRIKAAESL